MPDGGDSVEEKLSRLLLKYRITPHSTTGTTPSELLMGRKLRSHLDLLFPDLQKTGRSTMETEASS